MSGRHMRLIIVILVALLLSSGVSIAGSMGFYPVRNFISSVDKDITDGVDSFSLKIDLPVTVEKRSVTPLSVHIEEIARLQNIVNTCM